MAMAMAVAMAMDFCLEDGGRLPQLLMLYDG